MPKNKMVCCNFCEKKSNQVNSMIEGSPNVDKVVQKSYICIDCVKMCYEILFNEEKLVKEKVKKGLIKKDSGSVFQEKLLIPKNIVKYLDKVIIGQFECKKQLAVAISNHYKRIFLDKQDKKNDEFKDTKIEKSNVLLIGPTGSGKTLLAKTLAEMLDVPFAIADATSLTEAGYVGEDVESIISKLLRNCDFDVSKAQKGIVFIDEIDKIAKKGQGQSVSRDVSGEGVQQGLLKIIEGSVIAVPPQGGRKHPEQKFIYVDTTNILFICSGSFVGIENIIKRRYGKSGIGFSNINKIEDIFDQYNISQEDLIEFGLIPEFVGRLPVISRTDKLSTENLIRILEEPRDALVKQYKKILKMDNVDINFSSDAIICIAELVHGFGTGARGLRRVMEMILDNYLFNIDEFKNKKINISRDEVESILTHKKVL